MSAHRFSSHTPSVLQPKSRMQSSRLSPACSRLLPAQMHAGIAVQASNLAHAHLPFLGSSHLSVNLPYAQLQSCSRNIHHLRLSASSCGASAKESGFRRLLLRFPTYCAGHFSVDTDARGMDHPCLPAAVNDIIVPAPMCPRDGCPGMLGPNRYALSLQYY